jgi:O-antigen ligase
MVEAIILLILSTFWLGVIPGFLMKLVLGFIIKVHIIDVLVLLLVLLTRKFFTVLKNDLVVILVFSYIVSLTHFGFHITALLYLVRLISYIALFFVISEYKTKNRTNLIYRCLVINIVLICLLGILQYLLIPDLRDLYYLGWDDHLYRLVSTFLDPGFTGLILTLGFFLINKKELLKPKTKNLLSLIIVLAIGLTFSRASYLAFVSGVVVWSIFEKKIKWGAIFIGLLLSAIILIPKPEGEGVRLARSASVLRRVSNYELSLKLIRKYPLFGVGFDNVCQAKSEFIDISKQQNSCSGLDNSYLFIATTTGMIGFGVFLLELYKLVKIIIKNKNEFLGASMAGVFVHSLFNNSLFYPWVMLWMAIVLGLELRIKRNS